MFTGLIDKMKNYDELAGLIGHEVIHVNRRHTMKALCRNLSGYLFISFALSDVNGVMAVIGDNVSSLQSLSYSRSFERQADLEGLDLMIDNNINPQGMTNLFKRLQEEHDVSLPALLSTHPITEDRIDYIKTTIKSKRYQISNSTTLKQLYLSIKGKKSAK